MEPEDEDGYIKYSRKYISSLNFNGILNDSLPKTSFLVAKSDIKNI